MPNKCIYCKKEVKEGSALDVCESCGIGVWGQKMFHTIVRKMEDAQAKDDLCSTNTIGVTKLEKIKF